MTTDLPERVVEPGRMIEPGRVIDSWRSRLDHAPTLILIGGVHGNEPDGVAAIRRVFDGLRRDDVRVHGELIGLVGNVRALAIGARFVDRDLNRLWTADQLAAARTAIAAASSGDRVAAEQAELVELADALDDVLARARGPVYALDLHTTSAEGIPFGVVGATEAHRGFASELGIPGIVGIEEKLAGVLTRHLGERGCITLAVEGGRRGSRDAATNLEAAITIALAAAGVVDADDLTDLEWAREHLAWTRGDLPRLIEVTSRHEVRPEHHFRMEPGYANIQRTPSGALLARDDAGDIRAPFDGLVLLPLYQPQGADGFFYGRALD